MSEESFFGSPLFYRLCADGIVAVHFGVVVFIVLGLVLTLVGIFRKWDWVRNVWFRGGHLARHDRLGTGRVPLRRLEGDVLGGGSLRWPRATYQRRFDEWNAAGPRLEPGADRERGRRAPR